MAALSKEVGRQYPLVAQKVINYSDLTAGAGQTDDVFALPPNSQVIGGDIAVLTAFNSTTNTLSVGDASSATRYANAQTIASAARTALTITGFKTTLSEPLIRLTYARTGADATAGKVVVTVMYVVTDKTNEVQG